MSRVKLNMYEHFLSVCFNDCVGDLLMLDDVRNLDSFRQHLNTSRLQHSINVAYYSFLVCRVLHFDYRSAARAGLLHDLYHYDWRESKQPEGRHVSAHPKIALRNAQRNVHLNKVEADAIVKHMWPLTIRFPRYKESVVVSMVDKYCACCEVVDNMGGKAVKKAGFLRSVWAGGLLAK